MSSGIVETQSGSEQQPQSQISRTRLVQRLLAASSSLPNFVHDLILTQAHIVAGTEAAAFLIEPAAEGGTATMKPVAHIRPDESDASTRAAALNAFQEIMRPCIEQGKDGAIQIEGTNDGSESQFCLITLLRNEGNVVAASAVITRARDSERAQKLLTPMQLVAGYFDLFTLRRRDDQSRAIAQSHQHVLQLATSVATAEGFESAAMNLCNELAARTSATRVSLGWLKGDNIKLKALSHTEQFDKKQELSVQIVKVMEECVDNDEIVQYEPDGTPSNTVTREAQQLSRGQGGETILSLPLRRKGEIVGVVTLEFAPNQKIGPQAATGLAVAVDLLAPQLYDRYQNDRYLITKAGLSIQDLGKKALGPKHMLAKTVVILLIATVLVLFDLIPFVDLSPTYRVATPFQFTPIEKRAFSAPFENAALLEVMVSPGQKVKAGDVLMKFDARLYEEQFTKARSEANKFAIEAGKYRTDETKTAERLIAEAGYKASTAEAEYYKGLIDRATIVAPIDGEILSGDLKYKVGTVYRLGEPLMELGQPESLKAELHVAERDIQDVRIDSVGHLATNAEPSESIPFKVTRIVPLSEPKDGGNIFKVYAAPERISSNWLPGQAGEARVDVSERCLAWIWTHRFINFVRLQLWV